MSGDLSMRVLEHCDPHMALMVIDQLMKTKLYKPEDLAVAEKKVLAKTCLFGRMKGAGMEVVELQKKHTARISTLRKAVVGVEIYTAPLTDDSIAPAAPKYPALLELASLMYQGGEYEDSYTLLEHLALGVSPAVSEATLAQVQWGQMAAGIMLGKTSAVTSIIMEMKTTLRSAGTADWTSTVNDSLWLLHWALFVVFRPESKEWQLLVRTTRPEYNAIVYRAPHMLRYTTCAALLSPVENFSLVDFSGPLSQDKRFYHDDITDFLLTSVYEGNLFKGRELLPKAIALVESDVMLRMVKDKLIKALRRCLANTLVLHSQAFEMADAIAMLRTSPEEADELLYAVADFHSLTLVPEAGVVTIERK
ncbi:eukaryotic translation initiation factor 3 subunit E [Kipferlia bialata]|uniref:Eukaryotic translation initiation factor 3 subunit E n=1 Tax=Kipferlia bialata TaxID=797122 RepID=A0A391NNC7_9EUKA|nr:eukaryotic translation initiation factor 3 subunit E [Kipferlia bialata]|eukprot:g8621.t1